MSALKWFIAGSCFSGSLLFLAAGGFGDFAAPAAERPTAAVQLPDFSTLIERVGPSVVNVTTRSIVRNMPDVAERHFDIYRSLMGAPAERTVTGLGSGFVVDDDGYILTNAHVVEGVDEVYVRITGSKRELKARIVGTDPETDIALLKVNARGLRTAPVGSSASLRVGDWVAAIGSPFGFDNTITAGIVSAKERHLAAGSATAFLQSDVAINPGSSGGPLVNLKGEVVGINSKIYTRTGGYMGVSFAIPIETALKVTEQLRSRGSVARGFLGIEAQPLNETLAASFNLEAARGALVTAVRAESPASEAGIRPGDIVLSYAGKSIEEPGDLVRAVLDTAPGTRAELAVWRRNSLLHARVIVAPAPETPNRQLLDETGTVARRTMGLVLTELSPQQCERFNVPYGLLVGPTGRAADSSRLQAGDVIVAVNDARFATRAEFERLVEERAGMPVALLVMRDGRPRHVALDAELL